MRFNLLTNASGNSKTKKGGKDYLAAILHLAPSDLSGFNVCPMAQRASIQEQHPSKSACSNSCLNLAGRGAIAKGGLLSLNDVLSGARSNPVQAARMKRTRLYGENKAAFEFLLMQDLDKLQAKAQEKALIPVCRLNGTSDLDFSHIVARFPSIQFYDYSKRLDLVRKAQSFDNWAVVYSLHDGQDSKLIAQTILSRGGNVAAVFDTKKGQALPATWKGFPVIDGDIVDWRFLDAPGTVAGLRAKGLARTDQSGFVQAAGGAL